MAINKKFFLPICLFFLCFFALKSYSLDTSSDAHNFISMPDDVNSSLLKSIYEKEIFNINKFNDGSYESVETIKGNKQLKDIWLGSPIRNKEINAESLTLFFKPKNFRKINDIVLDDFNIKFTLKPRQLYVKHSDTKEYFFSIGDVASQDLIITNNNSDVVIFIPFQKADFMTTGFMVCPRVREEKGLKPEMNLIDPGYVIDKIKMSFNGSTKASFTTGSRFLGRIDAKIINSDTVSEPELAIDSSQRKDPNIELTYLPSGEKITTIKDDENIIGGLKFFYDMKYSSGKERISDYTNYVWVRRNFFDFPMKMRKHINGLIYSINIKEGMCYNIVLNAKTFSNTYLDNPNNETN